MGKLGFVLNGILLSGVLTILFLGSEGVAAPVVSKDEGSGPALSKLEAAVATDPTPANVGELATQYLDHGQPGLAKAALANLPNDADPQLTYLRSKVALAQGQVAEALSISEATLARCESDAACPNWLYAKTVHQVTVLRAMSAAGVEDPAQDPGRAQAAMDGAVHEVRLAHQHTRMFD